MEYLKIMFSDRSDGVEDDHSEYESFQVSY
jgi:hypothetical protein